MATIPQHSGYNVQTGVGSGINGDRIDVWLEWKLIAQEVDGMGNKPTSWVDMYFYGALKSGETSTTKGDGGAWGELEIDEYDGYGYSCYAWGYNFPYDFRSSSIANDFTLDTEEPHSYPYGTDPFEWPPEVFPIGLIHDEDGVWRGQVRANFGTPSSYISGGTVSAFAPSLPDIPMGFRPNVNGVWKTGMTYGRYLSAWRPGSVYAKSGGIWKPAK